MTALAPTLQAFFTDRLALQRQASGHTIAAYRDAIKMLIVFAAQRTGKNPSRLDIADLDAQTVGAFLNHLENDRGNTVRPATPGWPQSTPCSSTRRCATPSTPPTSSGSSRSRPSATTRP